MANIHKFKMALILFIMGILLILNGRNIYAAGDAISTECANTTCSERAFVNNSDPSTRLVNYYNGTGGVFTVTNASKVFLNSTTVASGVKTKSISSSQRYTTTLRATDYSNSSITQIDLTGYKKSIIKNEILPENTTVNYAIKIAFKDNGAYKLLYDDTEVAIKVLSSSSARALNLVTTAMNNDMVVEAEKAYEADKNNIDRRQIGDEVEYTFYLSKVYAEGDSGSYTYNHDKSASYISSNAFYRPYKLTTKTNPKQIIVYKYKDPDTGKYVEDKSKRIIVSGKSTDDYLSKYNAVSSKKNYNYVGVKFLASDDLDMEEAIEKVDTNYSKSYGYNKTEYKQKFSNNIIVISYYFDQRPVEVNYYLKASNNTNIIINKDKIVANGTNNVEYLGGADKDATYTYFGQTVTYNGKTYAYVNGEKSYASTLAKLRSGNGTITTWGSNSTQTKLVGTNYYGDGSTFNDASAVQINFYYSQRFCRTKRSVYTSYG